ncbi:MAG: hypothetical protein Q7S70_02205, partial [bacterium]|nr:hypothetical protein [bacterium]
KIDFLFTKHYCRAEEGNIRDINLVKLFLERGYSSGIIGSCQRIHAQLKKEGIFSIQLLREIKIPARLENLEERVRQIEQEYNIPSLKRFILAEQYYYNEDENHLFRKTVVYFEWLKKLFDQMEIGCLVNGQGGQIDFKIMHCLAQKKGIPIIYLGESFFPHKMLMFSDEMRDLGKKFQKRHWQEMTDQQKMEIEEHFLRFQNRQEVYRHSLMFNKKDEILRSTIALKEYLENKRFQALRITLATKFKEGLPKVLNKLISKFICQSVLKNEKFIYFPLHLTNDTQITVRNPHFFEQAALAVYIARSLPFGYKLYVKEHPGSLIAIKDKMALLREKNIVLLAPKLNSHDIIKKSEAVAIINSTVGLEALHYFKPVIVLGNWEFKGKGVTTDVEDLSKLDETIRIALKTKIDPAEIKAFLFSLKEAMYEGSIMEPTIDYNKVADSIVKRYQELKAGEI